MQLHITKSAASLTGFRTTLDSSVLQKTVEVLKTFSGFCWDFTKHGPSALLSPVRIGHIHAALPVSQHMKAANMF